MQLVSYLYQRLPSSAVCVALRERLAHVQPLGSARLGLPSVKTFQVGLGEIATVKFEISVKSHENSSLGEGVSLRVNNQVKK